MNTIVKFFVGLIVLLCIGIGLSILDNVSDRLLPLISALIGSVVTLFGVWLNSNWSDSRSLKERKNSILLASLDKRLNAHQEAYSYLRKLFKAANEDWDGGARKIKLAQLIDSAHDFWDKNTLYLSEDASNLFQLFIFNVVVFNKEDVSNQERDRVEKQLIDAGRALKQGVEIYLPDKTLVEELKG